MRIAIDAMGGDLAPATNVQGAIEAAREWSDTEIVLVGNSALIEPYMQSAPSNISIHHAEEKIEADDEPAKSVRRKKDASMVVAARLVREGKVDAMISAGNTGALMATALLIIGRIKGINRPALAAMIPTNKGKGVLALDMGSNMDATAENLLQYAIMGSIYRSSVHGLASPKVGLLNIGTEAMKGNELTKEVYPLLEKAPIQFTGNIEARDLLKEKCDVIICDGFVGNVLLKAVEGTAELIFQELKSIFMSSFMTKLAASILAPGLKGFKKKMDYTEHGAAPLLGVNGLCLKSHGSSDANAIKNAVRQARVAIQNNLVQAISSEISNGE